MRRYEKTFTLNIQGGSNVDFTIVVSLGSVLNGSVIPTKNDIKLKSSDDFLLRNDTVSDEETLAKVQEYEDLANAYADGTYEKSDLENSLINDNFKLSAL